MADFFSQYESNVNPGPSFEVPKSVAPVLPTDFPVRYIAYYLPQFHAIEENNEWWGSGFTEWTNVTRAVPRYEGHLQPRLPADLGFYNLDNPDVFYLQSALARRNGIEGFCIHNYWFGGRRVLERPLEHLLRHKDIDLPFCLNWANESWTRRWDGFDNDILLQQRYDSNDPTAYIKSIFPAITDDRYIKVAGRPLIMVYRPHEIPDARRVFDRWREFLIREGLGNPYLVMAQSFLQRDPKIFGMDAAAGFPPHGNNPDSPNLRDAIKLFDPGFWGFVGDYSSLASHIIANFSSDYVMLPGVCPGWDNEARKPRAGSGFIGSCPDRYASWLSTASRQVIRHNTPEERIVFINAWNEWAEGAILEPDRHFGHAFLNRTRQVLKDLASGRSSISQPTDLYLPNQALNYQLNRVRRKLYKITL